MIKIDESLTIPLTKPDVWSMPDKGLEWCDCGESHDLSKEMAEDSALYIAENPEWMTHKEVIEATMDLWAYVAVCEFFLMKVNDSATVIAGEPKEKYPFEQAVEIIGYFSKTWQGCPEQICETVFEA